MMNNPPAYRVDWYTYDAGNGIDKHVWSVQRTATHQDVSAHPTREQAEAACRAANDGTEAQHDPHTMPIRAI